MGGYRPYPEYKDSGVEWLGEVPNNWMCKRLKFLISSPLKYGANEAAELTDEDFPRYIRITDMNEDGTLKEETFRSLLLEVAKEYLLEDGDILLARSGATVGKSFIYKPSWGVAAYAGYLIRARMSSEMHANFAYYFLQSNAYWQWLNGIFIQATIQNVSAEKYASLYFPVPSKNEQKCIAHFLDHKTAQIDALIAKKELLLEKLAEKRTALISHAVTKGLDPGVKMKNSGVDWLGLVPAHWEVAQFSHCIYFQEGPGIMASDFQDDGIPLLRISNLKSGYVDLEGCNFVSPEKVAEKWSHFKLDLNDLLISSSASTGLVSVISEGAVGSIPYTGIIRLKPRNNSIVPDFIRIFVGSELFYIQINMLKTGTTIQHYGPAHLRQMRVTLPPVNEQICIFKYIGKINKNIEKMREKVMVAIEKLKEYRSVLVTQAITGKIDVRDYAWKVNTRIESPLTGEH